MWVTTRLLRGDPFFFTPHIPYVENDYVPDLSFFSFTNHLTCHSLIVVPCFPSDFGATHFAEIMGVGSPFSCLLPSSLLYYMFFA